MQVNNISRNNTSFKGLLNNKILLKGLEKVSEHGTSFAAGTSLVMSLGVRPLAILATPDVEKENKQYASANSICSGLIKFALVEAVALPVESAVKKIDKNPEKYLNNETIKNLNINSNIEILKQVQDDKNFPRYAENLAKSKSYRLGSQIIKLSTGFLTAVPKSMMTIALIPIVMDKLFSVKKPERKKNESVQKKPQKLPAREPAFTGNLSKGIGKIFDNSHFQNFLKKNQHREKDIPKHITAATDILLTSSFAYQTGNSNNIKENRKKALIYNNLLSTGVTLFGGYGIDKAISGVTEKFIKNFSKINAADPKLSKYIEGINIVRPAIIFAGIYYGILPMFSTYIAEKIDKFIEKKS